MVAAETGAVVGILDAPGPHPAGLASLDGFRWNVGFQTRKLYRIAVTGRQKCRPSDARGARIECRGALYNYPAFLSAPGKAWIFSWCESHPATGRSSR